MASESASIQKKISDLTLVDIFRTSHTPGPFASTIPRETRRSHAVRPFCSLQQRQITASPSSKEDFIRADAEQFRRNPFATVPRVPWYTAIHGDCVSGFVRALCTSISGGDTCFFNEYNERMNINFKTLFSIFQGVVFSFCTCNIITFVLIQLIIFHKLHL